MLGCLNDGTACDIAAVGFQLTVSALQDGLNRSRRRDPVGVPVDDAPANGFPSEDHRPAKVEVVALIRASEQTGSMGEMLDLHRSARSAVTAALTRSNERDVASRRLADASLSRLDTAAHSRANGPSGFARVASSPREQIRFFGSDCLA